MCWLIRMHIPKRNLNRVTRSTTLESIQNKCLFYCRCWCRTSKSNLTLRPNCSRGVHGTQHLVLRLLHLNGAIFLVDKFCNCLIIVCASFGERKKNETGCVVFELFSSLFIGGEKRIDLPLKSRRNKIIQILFRQCQCIHGLIWAMQILLKKFLWECGSSNFCRNRMWRKMKIGYLAAILKRCENVIFLFFLFIYFFNFLMVYGCD